MQKDLVNFKNWIATYFNSKKFNLLPLPHDASMRRYYRVTNDNKKYIAADSSFDLKVYEKFINVTYLLQKIGLCVPQIFTKNDKFGFLLLTDFGDQTYFTATTEKNFLKNYQTAINKIILLQQNSKKENLDNFSFLHLDAAFLSWELDRFKKYFLQMQLKIDLSAQEESILQNAFVTIINAASSQPQTIIHRDYHSKNLMMLSDKNDVGILDFQDAMFGPITYDLASLLRDCYVNIKKDSALQLLKYYFKNNKNYNFTFSDLIKYFDFISIQRDLKAIYTFSFKFLEHNDARYQPYIKTALNYIIETAGVYSEFVEFKKLFQKISIIFHKQNASNT